MSLSHEAFAQLVVINDSGNTVQSEGYLKNVQVPSEKKIMKAINDQQNNFDHQTIDANQVGYPDNSVFTPGRVDRHKIQKEFFNTVPLFVIGDDAKSIHWAKLNKNYLKKIDAIGIITNVQSRARTEEVEKKLGIKLIATNLKGLDKIVGTTHYPFLIKDGWIFQ